MSSKKLANIAAALREAFRLTIYKFVSCFLPLQRCTKNEGLTCLHLDTWLLLVQTRLLKEKLMVWSII